jgi:hypothetical protein
MLKNIKRWLGLEGDRSPQGSPHDPKQALPRPTGAAKATTAGKPGARPAQPKRAAKKPRDTMAKLDNPRLSLERPDEGFDPYNTGAFNRSQSWERIGKKKR